MRALSAASAWRARSTSSIARGRGGDTMPAKVVASSVAGSCDRPRKRGDCASGKTRCQQESGVHVGRIAARSGGPHRAPRASRRKRAPMRTRMTLGVVPASTSEMARTPLETATQRSREPTSAELSPAPLLRSTNDGRRVCADPMVGTAPPRPARDSERSLHILGRLVRGLRTLRR